MVRQLKTFTLRMVAGANAATVMVMLLVGFSGRLNPDSHPLLSNGNLFFPVFLAVNFAFLVFWLLFKWRWAWIPFVGYVVCYVPIREYMPLNISHDTPDGAIKILSYNVWGLSGNNMPGDSPEQILSYIAVQDADVVCLQEAYLAGRQAMIDSIIGDTYKYQDTACIPHGGDCIAVLSKYPILRKERIHYPSKGNLSAAFYLKMPHDTVIVINNHLETTGLSPEDRSQFKSLVKGEMRNKNEVEETSKLLIQKLAEATAKRAPQARAVAEYIRQHKGRRMIVCGDFNDGPQSYAHHTIAEGLTDCYISSGNGPGISYNRNGFYVRIDHILCSEDWEPYNCHVDRQIKSSDHYPIICWLKKNPKL